MNFIKSLSNIRKFSLFILLGSFLFSTQLFAHVKWFSSFDYLEKSKSISEVTNSTYWILVISSILVISLLIFLDKKLNDAQWNKKIETWLDERKHFGHYAVVIGTFTVLFISWAGDTILVPEIEAYYEFISWFQFFAALLILIPRTTAIGGAMLLLLYLYCVGIYGFFYMLNYLHFVGIAIYLIAVKSKVEKIKNLAMPAVYITLGFSLIYLAFEKLYYPSWSIQLLEQHPELALGLPHEFFVKASAFVEIGLGFMMLIGSVQRILALVITLTFITTSLFFGKIEVIGHTSLHAVLVLVIFVGTEGVYQPFIKRIWSTNRKILTSAFLYLLVTSSILYFYKSKSDLTYQWAIEAAKNDSLLDGHCTGMVDLSDSDSIPLITHMEVISEPNNMGNTLHVKLKNWRFTPESVGKPYTLNQGHIHVYIDGEKSGRMYSDWYYFGKLSKGKHKIAITINGDDHTAFTIGTKMIGKELEYTVK
jgi:uncharacterized membrane protein YphA (DoxX/SURF4 family)